MISEEARSTALLLASMKVTETESLLEFCDPNEPRTLSNVDQVGLTIIPCARCMSTTSSLSPSSFAARDLILRPLRSDNTEEKIVMLPTVIANNQKAFFCTHLSTLISIKVGDRNLTTLETNGVDWKWVKALSQDRTGALQ